MPITFYITGFRNNTAHDIFGWDELSLVVVSNPFKRILWTYEVNEVRIESSQDGQQQQQQQCKYSMNFKGEIHLQLEDKFESLTPLMEWLQAISDRNSKKPKVNLRVLESARNDVADTVGQIHTLLQPSAPKVSFIKKLTKSNKPHVANEIESIKEQLAVSQERFTSLTALVEKQLIPYLSTVIVLDRELERTLTQLVSKHKELKQRFKLADGKEKELRKAAAANEKDKDEQILVAETNDWKKGKALVKSRANESELEKKLDATTKELAESGEAYRRQVKLLEDEKAALQRSQSELKTQLLYVTSLVEEQKRALKASTDASILKQQEHTAALARSHMEAEDLKAKLATSREVRELTHQLSEKEQEVVILRKENTALLAKSQDLSRKLDEKEAELNKCQEKAKILEEQLRAAKANENELERAICDSKSKEFEQQRLLTAKDRELAFAMAKEQEHAQRLQELSRKIGEKDHELQQLKERKLASAKAKEKEHAQRLQELSLKIDEKDHELQQVNENKARELESAKAKEKEHARQLQELSLNIDKKDKEIQRVNESKERELRELRTASESQSKQLRETQTKQRAEDDQPSKLATLQAKEKEVERLRKDLNDANEKMAKLEQQHQHQQEYALSSLRAKFNGMHEVGSAARKSSSAFKELRDNTMTNQLLSLTENDPDLDIFFPVVTSIHPLVFAFAIFDIDEEYAFHMFWGTVLDEEEPNHDAKLKRANQIKDNKEEIQRCAEIVATATFTACKAAAANTSGALVTTGEHFHSHMLPFFLQCAQWHIDMVFCDPVLELLPRGRVPKKDTPLNNIEGQQFELSFDGYGIPIVDSVEKPGLMLCDLNGMIYQKAVLKCHFK